jgi:CheY-like chemotaxis protein
MSGTTIQTLPAGGPVAAGASTAAFARASILLVDDQPARLLSYEAILSGLNVHCVRALSGHEALAKLLKQDFAAILLDVNMPGMDGFEVARLIRGHPRLERTPIIFITGVHMTEMDQLKGYDVGAIDYMAVPVVPEILRSKVAVLVELFQRRSELQELNRSLAEARAQLEAAHSRDIAQRQAQWRESEARYRALIENAPVAVAHAALSGRLEYVNRAFCQLLGYAAEELLSKTWQDITHPDDVEADRAFA